MSDRELLELAAKAAGIELVWHGDADPWCFAETVAGIKWNPLDDDGDALRLAVKLEFYDLDGVLFQFFDDPLIDTSKDPLAAVRRAIVRAAAEIGRNMK